MSFVSDWTLSPAMATLLLTDLGRSVPQPFQPRVPYTTVAGRERLRASVVADDELRQAVAAFADAPVAVMALGVVDGVPLTARACWGAFPVLVTSDESGWRFTRHTSSSLFRALAAMTPDTPAAGGAPVTVASDAADPADDDPMAQPPLVRSRAAHTVERILGAPVAHSGMFVPVRHGDLRRAVHWRDTACSESGPDSPGTSVVRHVITSRTDRRGVRWMTYTPGDRSRVVAALRNAVTPLLRDEGTPHE